IGGLRVGLAEDRDQDVATVDLLASRRLHVRGGALEHALEAERLLWWPVLAGRQLVEMLVDPGAQLATEAIDVGAAGAEDVDDRIVLEQRVEHVLDAEELVTPAARVANGARQARLEGGAEPH